MVKRIVLTLLQFLVFVVLLAIGGYWDVIRLLIQIKAPSLNVIPLVKLHLSATHDLIANGLIFATVLLVILLIIQALRKALHPWASLSILAFVLAVILSFAMKLGMPPVETPDSSSSVPSATQLLPA